MATMKKGSVIFPRASRAQLVDTLSTTLNRKQIMIQIAQDNDTTPVEQSKLLREYLDTAETILPKPALIHRKSIDEMLREMINEQIDKLVEEKVAAIMSSHATIALISQEQRDIMQSLIDDHESEHDHDGFCTTGDMREIAEEVVMEIDLSEKIDRAVSRSSAVEEALEEKFDDKFDERFDKKIDDIDWEEKVREGLVNILS